MTKTYIVDLSEVPAEFWQFYRDRGMSHGSRVEYLGSPEDGTYAVRTGTGVILHVYSSSMLRDLKIDQ